MTLAERVEDPLGTVGVIDQTSALHKGIERAANRRRSHRRRPSRPGRVHSARRRSLGRGWRAGRAGVQCGRGHADRRRGRSARNWRRFCAVGLKATMRLSRHRRADEGAGPRVHTDGRVGSGRQRADVAAASVWPVSPASAFVTGHNQLQGRGGADQRFQEREHFAVVRVQAEQQ